MTAMHGVIRSDSTVLINLKKKSKAAIKKHKNKIGLQFFRLGRRTAVVGATALSLI